MAELLRRLWHVQLDRSFPLHGRTSALLSVTPGHSASYLTNQVGAGMESYYTGAVGAGEPPGVWHGKGAEALGLEGEVDADVMSALYERYLDPTDERFTDPETRYGSRTLGNRPKEYRTPDAIVEDRTREYTTEHASTPTPEQIQAWRLEAEKNVSAAAHFYDLTFSPDKSVTVLWTAFTRAAAEADAAGDADTAAGWQWAADQVEDALMDASARALDYVERTAAFTRTGRHGARSVTGHWADTQGLTAARFRQHTSREGDPQLHVHQAVLNKVQTAEGRWLALDGEAVHAARSAAGAIAERALELDLTRRLGIQWEMREDGVGRRVVGVDPQLEDLFSARTRVIGPEAERRLDAFEAMYGRPANAIERATIVKKVTLATRPGKTGFSESPDELNARWHAEASGSVAGGLSGQAHRFRHVLDHAASAARVSAAALDTAGSEVGSDVEQLLADRLAGGPEGPGEGETFSLRAVLAEALEACHGSDGKSTFTRHDLIRQINLALPDDLGALAPGEAERLLEHLADEAMQSADVVQVSGFEVGRVPDSARRADGTADTVNPARIAYATRGHLSAEWAVLRSAGEHGRTALPRFVVEDWLEAQPVGQALSPAQREALLGLATSDAAAAVLVGPAGTGKSFTAAAFDVAWRDLTAQLAEHRNPDVRARYGPGRAVGVAITQAAADVLAEDGVTDSANIAAFLTAQRRLTEGRPLAGDERWRLGPNDVLLVDEASMADTASLNRLQAAADTAGARVVLMGDPHQLGPVGAGGMMRAAIDRNAQTFTLSEVRRFTHDWEATASLRLRDGHADAVTDYDAHGRLIDAGREKDAIAAIARAAAADRLAGKDTVVITSSNEHAAQVAAAVRRHLADVGHVGKASILLDRDGTTAGVGDLVQARRIDRQLGLVNREVYRIDAVDEHGTLTATCTRTSQSHTIPADYAAADLSLAYASTAHGAQGRTVDTSHLLLTPTSDRAGAYVGLTRGRESNTAWAITDTGIPNPDAPTGTTVHTARGLLARALATETGADEASAGMDLRARADAAAVDIADADARARRDAGTLLGLIEDETRLAARARLDEHLDTLTAEGLLTDTERARFGAEQGTEHLAKLLRAHEHAGADALELLRDGVTAGDFTKVNALSQVVAARIDKRHPLPTPAAWPQAPAAVPTDAAVETSSKALPVHDQRAAYLEQLHGLYAHRARELGAEFAAVADADPASLPNWVTRTLGQPMPTDVRTEDGQTLPIDTYASTGSAVDVERPAALTREEWTARVGAVAAQREASGWTHPDIALGRCPGVSTPEKRAAWHAAYTAAGMPEEQRPEAEMTEGRLLVRARAAERARAIAPPAVYEAQRERHRLADQAERDSVLARAQSRPDDADQLAAAAAEHRSAATQLDEVADARARWLLHHTETLAAGDSARAELYRRGLGPRLEADRTSAQELLQYREWLEAEERARIEDDAHRTITESDVSELDGGEVHSAELHEAEDVRWAGWRRTEGLPRGVTQVERQQIIDAAAVHGLEIDVQTPVVPDTDAARTDESLRPPVAAALADIEHLASAGLGRPGTARRVSEPRTGTEDDAGGPSAVASLTAGAATAEVEAAAAAAVRAAERLADEASQNAAATATEDLADDGRASSARTEDTADDGSWDARRSAQINAENDAVAQTGRWHDAGAEDHGVDYGADNGINVAASSGGLGAEDGVA
ncbi:MobF family relaxase [Kineosporia sp. R_H_3]|uniref:MobF family relaxase n=1 Tax=Kineosporia sp. R_H_3 TaxID=1961848 RepID=UPI00117B8870|nr:MobF family relaxase [Kineosporia sp. R_H_3]